MQEKNGLLSTQGTHFHLISLYYLFAREMEWPRWSSLTIDLLVSIWLRRHNVKNKTKLWSRKSHMWHYFHYIYGLLTLSWTSLTWWYTMSQEVYRHRTLQGYDGKIFLLLQRPAQCPNPSPMEIHGDVEKYNFHRKTYIQILPSSAICFKFSRFYSRQTLYCSLHQRNNVKNPLVL